MQTAYSNIIHIQQTCPQTLVRRFHWWPRMRFSRQKLVQTARRWSNKVCFLFELNAVQAKRLYPDYKPKGELSQEQKSAIALRIRDLFTSRVGGVVVNFADTIVISAFLGLIPQAQYQNYFLIGTSLIGLVSVVFQPCLAGVGNSLLTDTQENSCFAITNSCIKVMHAL